MSGKCDSCPVFFSLHHANSQIATKLKCHISFMTHKLPCAMIGWFTVYGQRGIYSIIDYKKSTIKNYLMFSFYRWGNGNREGEMTVNWSLIEFIKLSSDYITLLFNIIQWILVEFQIKSKFLTMTYEILWNFFLPLFLCKLFKSSISSLLYQSLFFWN